MSYNENLCQPPEYPYELVREDIGGFLEQAKRRREIEEIVGDMPIDRLRELVEADRDGRCVVLPCKVGSKVYALEDRTYWKDVPCPDENECEYCDTDCRYYQQNMIEETQIAVQVVVSMSDMENVMRSIGKTVFLTREAAEAALKGKQHGN